MNKWAKILLFVVIGVIAASGGIAYGTFVRYQEDTAFLENTSLGGTDIGGSTPSQVADALADYYDTGKIEVRIVENGEDSITGTLAEFGYRCDRASFEALLEQALKDQRRDFWTLMKSKNSGYKISHDEVYLFDEDVFLEKVTCDHLAVPRVETVDPSIAFDEEKNYYYTVPGSEGNMIDETKLQSTVRTTLDGYVNAGRIPRDIEIPITEDLYTSVPPLDNLKELQKECDAKNLEIRKEETLNGFKDTSVTYEFGSEKEVLDAETIMSWITVDDTLAVTLDDSKIEEYVTHLKATYDTQFMKRKFKTTMGTTVTIKAKNNEYGYTIDYQKECAKLRKNILARKAVSREPVYLEKNEYDNPYHLKRNGKDDLCGTYVEVNITQQHLWFYKDGQLIIESDIVSGCVSKKKETHLGCLPLAFKQSPRTLVGDEAGGSGSYRTNVNYWMPFYNGQGLHDASWRRNFGGQIYQTNGSHGCVNLPPAVAETIYNNIEEGTAIILYKEKTS